MVYIMGTPTVVSTLGAICAFFVHIWFRLTSDVWSPQSGSTFVCNGFSWFKGQAKEDFAYHQVSVLKNLVV